MAAWKDSITLWTTVLNKELQGSFLAYNNRAMAFVKMRQYDKAIDDYTRAIELNPRYFVLFSNRGEAYMKAGRLDEAARDFDKVMASARFHLRAYDDYVELGNLYGKAGAPDKAVVSLGKAIIINPGGHAAYNDRGFVYSLLGQDDKALEHYNRAIDLNTDYAAAYVNRANLYFKMGGRELAVRDFRKACSLGNKAACDALQPNAK